ncbi:MAG: amidohydrolase, partial [Gemmatimonadota bacterium]
MKKSTFRSLLLVGVVSMSVGACASASPNAESTEATPRVIELPAARASRTLASYERPAENQQCYDREAEPYTAIVDSHFHPRPFGGAAIEPTDLYDYFERLGVRFVNYFGIGQVLELDSGCTYYLDCPGVTAMPSVKNDFVNGMETVAYSHDNLHITLSMTFMDLAHPEEAAERIREYDREYPGMFTWAGELNVIKQ